ncbi:uncharacterized protein LOC124363371 [Homalodisca vitripennis]|uniref:uncharacterized protein LOC124363371 n=1 Tax=Homalodisca vitripennis TaxID=197043 RepID=UPI001EE9C95D|nr:uncharacterized protein LOC124363371 [Homalodisca vitripennis]
MDFSSSVEEIVALNNFAHIHLIGDFNLPGISWTSSQVVPNHSAIAISEMAELLGLSQVIHLANDRGVILDLVFTSSSSAEVTRDVDPLVAEDIHHPSLSMELDLPVKRNIHSFLRPDLRKCNLQAVFSELQRMNIMSWTMFDDVDASFAGFCKTIGDCVVRNSPLKKHSQPSFPIWFSKKLVHLTLLKNILHKQFKLTFDVTIYRRFAAVRSECKSLTKICFLRYVNHVQEVLPSNPKIFWTYLKACNRSDTAPSVMSFEDTTSSDDVCIANMFADFFSSVFGTSRSSTHTEDSSGIDAISTCLLDYDDVQSALTNLDVSKGPGPDSISLAVVAV